MTNDLNNMVTIAETHLLLGTADADHDLDRRSRTVWTKIAPGATYNSMTQTVRLSSRIFKTAWFTKVARKARIHDDELCKAIAQVIGGQADDLGGGVFKKRLNRNMHRAVVTVSALDSFDECF